MDGSSPDVTFPALVTTGSGYVLSANAAADEAAGRPLAGMRLLDLLPERRRHWTTFRHHACGGAAGEPLRIPILTVDRREVEVDVHVWGVVRRRGLAARACQLI